MRERCAHCRRPLEPDDFSEVESRAMEAERKALGLEGVRFRYYYCSACDHADIFVEVCPLPGESRAALGRRLDELDEVVRSLPTEGVKVVLVYRDGSRAAHDGEADCPTR
jgi:hypothetical protein